MDFVGSVTDYKLDLHLNTMSHKKLIVSYTMSQNISNQTVKWCRVKICFLCDNMFICNGKSVIDLIKLFLVVTDFNTNVFAVSLFSISKNSLMM